MRKSDFHVLYYEKQEDIYSKGITYKNTTIENTLEIFKKEYPNAIIVSIYDIKAIPERTFQN